MGAVPRMTIPPLRFFSQDWRQATALGFSEMEQGLRKRRKRFAEPWQEHLRNSQDFQAHCCADAGSDHHCIILGAGGLYDVNLPALSACSKNICFVDASPGWRFEWRRAARKFRSSQFSWFVCDVTGLLSEWDSAFRRRCPRGFLDACQMLSEWHNKYGITSEAPDFGPHSLVLSLNMLSQIPLVWQHCVERTLLRRFGLRAVKAQEHMWMQALIPSARALAHLHLQFLSTFGADRIVLITDVEYMHYHLREHNQAAGCPLQLCDERAHDDGSHWERAAGIQGDLSAELLNATFGLTLESDGDALQHFPAYRLSTRQTWLWHIVPANTEQHGVGEINRVLALFLQRNSSADEIQPG